MDAIQYRRQEVAESHAQRWAIELDLPSIKTHMGMEMLRCKSADIVEKGIAIYFLAYNLIRASLVRAAKQFAKIPRVLSFRSAVQLFTQGSSQLGFLSGKALLLFSQAIFKAIASTPIAQQKCKKSLA